MKKSIKLISLFIITLVMIFVGKETVFAADNAPSKFTAVSSKITKKPLGLTNNISVKKTSNGTYVYCYDVNKTVPNNVTYNRYRLVTNPIVNYIIGSGLEDKTEDEFFATQAALWIYLYDNGKMNDTSYNYIANIKKAIANNPNDPIAADINKILRNAKNLGSYYMEDIEIEQSSVKLDSNDTIGDNYVTEVIEVNKMNGDYTIELDNAPKGTLIVKRSNGFIVKIPESSLKEGTTSFSITVKFDKYTTYMYTASNSKYQEMMLASLDKSTDSVKISVTKEVEEPTPEKTIVKISKQDITNKGVELPGATLVIKDSKGNIVEKWVSGNKAKEFDSLPVGKYTLTETIAPEGYELSSETISFEVKEDGEIITKTMYNTPKKLDKTIVKISKQDITNKGVELPGATLVIKDSKGNVVEKWVSGTEVKVFNALEVGKYTLTETIAPEGYELSSETISFEVKEDGEIITKTMYNTPKKVEETIVKISKQDITTKEELEGATLVIKDSNGKEIYRWVSEKEPYVIKGLEEGTYTLTEIQAPNGYVLSEETITFEVKNNGEVAEVVMFNTPEVTEIIEVPATGLSASSISYIIGGLVIIIGSVLIYRNAKKEQ